jgi:RHS repeat-associated protein
VKLTDLNKDIGSQTASGIIYNHLNLPWQISFRSATGTKGTITYIYDAAGNKLKKTALDSAGNLETVTTYIGPFQYQATAPLTGTGSGNLIDTLKFFGHSEGRVRVENDTTGGQTLASYKYDYFLKDHLGNTRMVLTDEQQTDMYPAATMEVSDSATENLYYMNLDSTRSTLPPGYPTDTTTNPNNYVAKVSGSSSGPAIGPGVVLKVMAGDQFSIRVSSWYRLNGTTPGTPINPITDILTHLISGMAGIPNPENPGLAALQNNSPVLSSNVLNFLQDTGTTINSSKPHAFVNWILLDNQYNYVAASSGFSQVRNDQELHITTLTNLPIASSGYLYIYTSNETPNVDVFFDNFQVTHTRGPLLEEDHYYPFGLTMAGISDKALKAQYSENKYRFNGGNELQHQEFSDGTGLETYDATHRMYDAQLGRFWRIDRFAEITHSYSPYAFALNNPILFNDPLGDTTTLPAAYVTALNPNSITGQLNKMSFGGVDAWVGMMMTQYHHSATVIDDWAMRNKWLTSQARNWIINGTSDVSVKYRKSRHDSWNAQGEVYKFLLLSALSAAGGEIIGVISEGEEGAVAGDEAAEGVEATEASINTADDLLNNVKLDGKILKNGELQGEIEGNAADIESSVAKDATQVASRGYKLNDGTRVTFYESRNSGPSMQINTGDVIYKIRIK